MPGPAIKFENISKQYRLGNAGTGTLSHDLNRWWAMNIRGKEDPYLKIGSVNDRSAKADSDYVWALRNIDFEVQQGEVLGIIGKNGAGKSTLLKILSRITSPTTGRITAHGRISSLLEVGTGFHPEMTGRENIFMNGAIMGMTKAEIRRKMDEIIDFAGVERYIDTPVKRYSSGMIVRLGFAVAAHLEPEILVVDEVLAVGDAEFQKKAIGKMQDISKGEGRTVLFVSHNMAAIKQLCSSCILLNDGQIDKKGTSEFIVREYNTFMKAYDFQDIFQSSERKGNQKIKFSKLTILNQTYNKNQTFLTGEDLHFYINVYSKTDSKRVNIGLSFHDENDEMLTVIYSGYQNYLFDLNRGENTILFTWSNNYLGKGEYLIRGLIFADGEEADWPMFPLAKFVIEDGNFFNSGNQGYTYSRIKFLIKGEWTLRENSVI